MGDGWGRPRLCTQNREDFSGRQLHQGVYPLGRERKEGHGVGSGLAECADLVCAFLRGSGDCQVFDPTVGHVFGK